MKHKEVYEVFSQFAPITESQWVEFEREFEVIRLKKGEVIQKPGEDPKRVFFVQSGILRNYYADTDGREYTKLFRGKGGFLGPYAEYLEGSKAMCTIQAVVNTEVVQCSLEPFEQMIARYSEWVELARRIAEFSYVEKTRREYMLLQLSASEKYEWFRKEFGEMSNFIPQYQVASYLGITPESFNRLLKKMNKDKSQESA